MQIDALWAQACCQWPGSGQRTRQAWEVGFWLFGKQTQGPRNLRNGLEAWVLALCTTGFSPCEEDQSGHRGLESTWPGAASAWVRGVGLEGLGLHSFICKLRRFVTQDCPAPLQTRYCGVVRPTLTLWKYLNLKHWTKIIQKKSKHGKNSN